MPACPHPLPGRSRPARPQLTAVSQYNHYCVFDDVRQAAAAEGGTALRREIVEYWRSIRADIALPSYVMDLCKLRSGRWVLIELNPFETTTGGRFPLPAAIACSCVCPCLSATIAHQRALCHPELKVSTPAHTKHLGWYLEFEFRCHSPCPHCSLYSWRAHGALLRGQNPVGPSDAVVSHSLQLQSLWIIPAAAVS